MLKNDNRRAQDFIPVPTLNWVREESWRGMELLIPEIKDKTLKLTSQTK